MKKVTTLKEEYTNAKRKAATWIFSGEVQLKSYIYYPQMCPIIMSEINFYVAK